MKFLIRVHQVIDYLVGFFLIGAPWLLEFTRGGFETWVPVAAGSAVLFYSFFTDYESRDWRLLPFRTHLILDACTGLVLCISPWVFAFSDRIYAPHFLIGLIELSFLVVTVWLLNPRFAWLRSRQQAS